MGRGQRARSWNRGALAAAVAVGLVVWGPVGLTGAAEAALPAGCTQAGQTVTCAFATTGTEQTFVVPAGISSLSIAAAGAAGGGGGGNSAPGGLGGTASGVVTVTPGSTLYVEVGGVGQAPGAATGSSAFDGGGLGRGGGASDVRTVSCGAGGCPGNPASLGSRLIVAGGGGGSAFYGVDPYGNQTGGTGGAAGAAGASGVAIDLAGIGGGDGGAPGTTAAGGAGGAGGGVYAYDPGATPGNPGAAGALGQGGAGGARGAFGGDGAGGGGGYYGGGGGGGGGSGSGGGGGGGSSWVTPAASGAGTGTPAVGTAPSVTITYTAPTYPMPPTCRVTRIDHGPPATETVTVRASAGLASITDISIINGTVAQPQFTPGTTDPVHVKATKLNPRRTTVWSFPATDENGSTTSCSWRWPAHHHHHHHHRRHPAPALTQSARWPPKACTPDHHGVRGGEQWVSKER
jgi:hypothetical protein